MQKEKPHPREFILVLGVGFEPTPPERVHLKCNALDRSAIQAMPGKASLVIHILLKSMNARACARTFFFKFNRTRRKAQVTTNI
jgi:hypothetical protein